MQIVLITKKTIKRIFIIVIVLTISAVYSQRIRKEIVGTYMNNEKETPICSVDVPDKRICITFDCNWGDDCLEDILATLKRYSIKGTFFLTGNWAKKHTSLVEEIYNQGHEIGNHSQNHIRMVGLTNSEIKNEIIDGELIISEIIGRKTTLFRMPYGEFDNRLIKEARKINYSIIKWDVDSCDYKDVEPSKISKKVMENIRPGSIILFHSSALNTCEALSQIIEDARKDGYKFYTVSELLLKNNYYIDGDGRQKQL